MKKLIAIFLFLLMSSTAYAEKAGWDNGDFKIINNKQLMFEGTTGDYDAWTFDVNGSNHATWTQNNTGTLFTFSLASTGQIVISGAASSGMEFNNDVPLALGSNNDARFTYETADANANSLILSFTEGGATYVPVFAVGDKTAEGANLGLFDGITDPSIAVLSDDAASSLYMRHDGTDAVIQNTEGDLVIQLDEGTIAINKAITTTAADAGSWAPQVVTYNNPISGNNLPVASNTMILTTTNAGETITSITGGKFGQMLTIIFVGTAITIDDNDADGANTANLAGSATDFVSSDDDTLTLIYDGTSWREVSRSVN